MRNSYQCVNTRKLRRRKASEREKKTINQKQLILCLGRINQGRRLKSNVRIPITKSHINNCVFQNDNIKYQKQSGFFSQFTFFFYQFIDSSIKYNTAYEICRFVIPGSDPYKTSYEKSLFSLICIVL